MKPGGRVTLCQLQRGKEDRETKIWNALCALDSKFSSSSHLKTEADMWSTGTSGLAGDGSFQNHERDRGSGETKILLNPHRISQTLARIPPLSFLPRRLSPFSPIQPAPSAVAPRPRDGRIRLTPLFLAHRFCLMPSDAASPGHPSAGCGPPWRPSLLSLSTSSTVRYGSLVYLCGCKIMRYIWTLVFASVVSSKLHQIHV
jgi:hypothetical protein